MYSSFCWIIGGEIVGKGILVSIPTLVCRNIFFIQIISLIIQSQRDAIWRKNLLLFGFVPNGLDPPPCVFEILWGTFLKPYFLPIKVPQSVWIFVILPHFPWIMSKPKQKKVPHHLWTQVTKVPPKVWNKATPKHEQIKKFLKKFGFGHDPPPLPLEKLQTEEDFFFRWLPKEKSSLFSHPLVGKKYFLQLGIWQTLPGQTPGRPKYCIHLWAGYEIIHDRTIHQARFDKVRTAITWLLPYFFFIFEKQNPRRDTSIPSVSAGYPM